MSDWRIFHCKDCGAKIQIDADNESYMGIAGYWDEYHSGCRKRIEEQNILTAMRLRNKSLIYWLPDETYEKGFEK